MVAGWAVGHVQFCEDLNGCHASQSVGGGGRSCEWGKVAGWNLEQGDLWQRRRRLQLSKLQDLIKPDSVGVQSGSWVVVEAGGKAFPGPRRGEFDPQGAVEICNRRDLCGVNDQHMLVFMEDREQIKRGAELPGHDVARCRGVLREHCEEVINGEPSGLIITVSTSQSGDKDVWNCHFEFCRSMLSFRKCVEQLMQGSQVRISFSQASAIC